MAEITENGYVSLRTLIVKKWNQFILLDDENNKAFETELTEDNWIHSRDTQKVIVGRDDFGRPRYEDIEFESNQELEYEIIISGEDVDSLPVTVNTSQLKTVNSVDEDKNEIVSQETFDEFTFENENDQLTIKHKIEVPIIG